VRSEILTDVCKYKQHVIRREQNLAGRLQIQRTRPDPFHSKNEGLTPRFSLRHLLDDADFFVRQAVELVDQLVDLLVGGINLREFEEHGPYLRLLLEELRYAAPAFPKDKFDARNKI
jgi:hypothetical protein